MAELVVSEGKGAARDVINVPVEIELDAPSRPVTHVHAAAKNARNIGDTRPSKRLGRQLSLKSKGRVKKTTLSEEPEREAFQRNTAPYSSLPSQGRSSGDDSVPVRRANSLTEVDNSTRYEQWEEMTVNFGNLRQSSRRLKDRIDRQ